MKIRDIPAFTRDGSYEVNVCLDMLVYTIERYQTDLCWGSGLQLIPDFQRGHVWSDPQRSAFVEFFLKGGSSGRVIYLNSPFWMSSRSPKPTEYSEFVVVDGLQRLTALMMFVKGEIPAFGYFNLPKGATPEEGKPYFEDDVRMARANSNLRINVNNLKTREEVLQWYLDLNYRGTPHADTELDRVRALLKDEQAKKVKR